MRVRRACKKIQEIIPRVKSGSRESQEMFQRVSGEDPVRVRRGFKEGQERVQRESKEVPKSVRRGFRES